MAGSYITISYNPKAKGAGADTFDFKVKVGSGYTIYWQGSKDTSRWYTFSSSDLYGGSYIGSPYWNYSFVKGEFIRIKGIGNSGKTHDYPIIQINNPHGYFDISGDLESLVEGEGSTATTVTIPPYAFSNMFTGNTIPGVVDISDLIFPTNLSAHCCENMFVNCKYIIDKVPELPATTLTESCYSGMFKNCTALTEAPDLLATNLAPNCYKDMFNGCNSLDAPIELPATALPQNCYEGMFRNCKGINMSDIKGPNYIIPYRIPAAGTGTNPSGNATTYMFTDISPDTAWQGTPNINQTYYLYQETPELNAIFVGVNGKAKRVNKMFIGVKGTAQRVRNLKIGYKGHAVELR